MVVEELLCKCEVHNLYHSFSIAVHMVLVELQNNNCVPKYRVLVYVALRASCVSLICNVS